MINKVRKTICDYAMVQRSDRILIALSGGPDSVCLLYLLCELKKELGFKLHLAHLNHGIRREAAGDVNYVRQLSRKFNIPLTVAKRDIPKIVKEKGGSIEMVARDIRYHFLTKTAKEVGANKIALGHNQDDQVETFLLNFLRGAGITGLSGMPAKRKLEPAKNKSIFIIRPLIKTSRKEILAYLSKKGLHPRFDSSNLDSVYKRNKIRLKLLPLLKNEYNPNIKNVIARTTQIFEEENAFWQNYLKTIFKNIVTKAKKGIQLDVRKLLTQAKAVQNRVIQEALKQFSGDLKGVSFEHIVAIRKLCRREQGRKVLTLPGGLQAVKDYGALILERCRPEPSYFFELSVKTPGENLFSDLSSKLEVRLQNYNENNIRRFINKMRSVSVGEKFEAIFDKDKLKFPLIIRNKRPGDRFQQLGFSDFTKLKNYFINKKIGLLERKKIPLLIDSQGRIAWVIGNEIANWSKVTKKTKKILRLKYFKQKNTI